MANEGDVLRLCGGEEVSCWRVQPILKNKPFFDIHFRRDLQMAFRIYEKKYRMGFLIIFRK